MLSNVHRISEKGFEINELLNRQLNHWDSSLKIPLELFHINCDGLFFFSSRIPCLSFWTYFYPWWSHDGREGRTGRTKNLVKFNIWWNNPYSDLIIILTWFYKGYELQKTNLKIEPDIVLISEIKQLLLNRRLNLATSRRPHLVNV